MMWIISMRAIWEGMKQTWEFTKLVRFGKLRPPAVVSSIFSLLVFEVQSLQMKSPRRANESWEMSEKLRRKRVDIMAEWVAKRHSGGLHDPGLLMSGREVAFELPGLALQISTAAAASNNFNSHFNSYFMELAGVWSLLKWDVQRVLSVYLVVRRSACLAWQ